MSTTILKTEQQIAFVKDIFSATLAEQLQLMRVSAPLAILSGTGINDDLNGIERPVSFPILQLNEQQGVVVHSLAKWKRVRLKELGIPSGKGILTDMKALRPDEDYSPIHSIYVDQWDWEKHIDSQERTLAYLKKTVSLIYEALRSSERSVQETFPEIQAVLPDAIHFIHAEELLLRYPDLTEKEREDKAAREFGAVFIMGIGGKLSHGERHDGRAPDYDDWSTKNEDGHYGLNGDILVWHPVLERAFELSSMGIRVDQQALQIQLKELGCEDRKSLWFHKQLLAGELPQSIGGGIGQSRVCMFLLKKRHIGEVQASVWSEHIRAELQTEGITLL